jgi:cell division septation protein DedD
MKKLYTSIIILGLILLGCGKDQVKPSADSTLTQQALNSIRTIITAYEEKDRNTLRNHLAPGIADSILEELSFEKAELSFVPRMVRIIGPAVNINLTWQGTWTIQGNGMKNRGIAVFVLEGEPLKLVKVEGDTPFLMLSKDKQQTRVETKENQSVAHKDANTHSEFADSEKQQTVVDQESDAIPKEKSNNREPDQSGNLEQSAEQSIQRQGKYYVQVGAWKHIEYAQETLDKLKKKHPSVYMVEENNFNIVRIPGIMTKQHGKSIIKNIEKELNLKPILYLRK